MFQSTPGYEAGRFPWRVEPGGHSPLFQSTPGYEAGRFYRSSGEYCAVKVSIHARL